MDFWSALIGSLLTLAGVVINALMTRSSEKMKLQHAEREMMFQDRKMACKKVITAMYQALKTVRKHQSYDEAWRPIDKRHWEELEGTMSTEALFIGTEGQKGVDLFLKIMADTVAWEWRHDSPLDRNEDRILRDSYEQMCFLYSEIKGHFQSHLEGSRTLSLLFHLNLVETCRFLCASRFDGKNSLAKT
jgi:hypothetical protein